MSPRLRTFVTRTAMLAATYLIVLVLIQAGVINAYLQATMVARMRELNPRITDIAIPDAGHYIHDDQPELVAQAVAEFLQREDSSAR